MHNELISFMNKKFIKIRLHFHLCFPSQREHDFNVYGHAAVDLDVSNHFVFGVRLCHCTLSAVFCCWRVGPSCIPGTFLIHSRRGSPVPTSVSVAMTIKLLRRRLIHSERRPQIFIPKRKSTSIVSSNWQHKFL